MKAKILLRVALGALIAFTSAVDAIAENGPAKQLFGAQTLPTVSAPQSSGFYSKGCLAGGVALPVDGPAWQVMRLSRNRRWGHPRMIALLERLARDAATKDGWPGLLVGDISQPRGGPMLTGHASHQVGLDADIWLTPMPKRRFTDEERENVSATSMLKGDTLYVDPDKWSPARTALLKRAASYPEVERIFVHPGIKKKLCDSVQGDRSWMAKIRPYWGHFYHFHVRIKCQPGSPNCKPQESVGTGDGCGKSLAWWFTDEPWKKAPEPAKPVKPKVMMLSDLPKLCAQILNAPGPKSVDEVTYGAGTKVAQPAAASGVPAAAYAPEDDDVPEDVPIPGQKP
ncbi:MULTISPECIES: penicillin-insensitive murein endopeptidase [Phyllobacterium]|jgi:penicillin-insensitive murein DD-endopeptidase|uniref:Penicillin-insensitive murein endopeptidase n=1 Tax=Phyllobacterium sophorae TaxID=1520277 RepID=A0A2P7BL84_9HYPH|nr:MULTISPECIES: penicillin-insensitive murein endopeptidase [Phyllobacterium]PSH67195.1 penicillin-insensitive murein endopeptidase [Phyllobacterium sophorae]UXN65431.1 penicillin-insensitive murein endopeptidase [Phyllobacterium sp. A18/5-2]